LFIFDEHINNKKMYFVLRKKGGFEAEKREHSRWIREDRRKIRESVNGDFYLTRQCMILFLHLLFFQNSNAQSPTPKSRRTRNSALRQQQ
jgi:hypothetical protein